MLKFRATAQPILYETQTKSTKNFPADELGVTISYVGHAFKIYRLMCFELVVWSLQTIVYSYWQNNFRTVFTSWGKIGIVYQIYIFKTVRSNVIKC